MYFPFRMHSEAEVGRRNSADHGELVIVPSSFSQPMNNKRTVLRMRCSTLNPYSIFNRLSAVRCFTYGWNFIDGAAYGILGGLCNEF